MPSYNLWTNQEILATTAKRNYTLADLEQFFTDIGYPDGWSMYQNTGYLLGNLTAPGVEVADFPSYLIFNKFLLTQVRVQKRPCELF